jgi:hypothetical protein
MMRFALCLMAFLVLAGPFSQKAESATWEYHNDLDLSLWSYYCPPDYPPYNNVTIYGTIDCVIQEPPLWQGTMSFCETRTGCVPEWCNDYLVVREWAPACTCNNVDYIKVVIPEYTYIWELLPLAQWIDENLEPGMPPLPTMGDPDGDIRQVYCVINLLEWLDSYPLPPEDWYYIENGVCEQLPGFLFSTEPIIFDPYMPPDMPPFIIEALTGELLRDGDLTFEPGGGTPPRPSTWGKIKGLFRE